VSLRVIGFEGPLYYLPQGFPLEEVCIRWGGHLQMLYSLWRAMSDCDIIMDIGGGDVFSDTYGTYYFSRIAYSKTIPLARRKPLILSPQSLGPFRSVYTRFVAAYVLRRCRKVFTRDTQSIALLGETGVKCSAESVADVAFRLPFTWEPRVPRETIRFGLNVSGLLYSPESSRFSFGLRANYQQFIDRVIESLIQRPNISVVLVPHHVLDGPYGDVDVCRRLSEKFKVELAPKFSSPSEAKSFISGLDVLAGSRMHATIAAVSSGVPAIPLAYSAKFAGVFASLEYPLVCDLRSQDIESLVSSIHDAVDRLPELRVAAEKSNAIAQSKLDRYQQQIADVVRCLN
jgi:colanic acid/amylovoran biosynthesis protein